MRLVRVRGDSMAPTLKSGDLLVVRDEVDPSQPLFRGALVVSAPRGGAVRPIVKRLIGLPGDEVARSGRTWQLGTDDYFLAGDAPHESCDSRMWGPVRRRELVGRVWLRLWPLTFFSRQPT